jgi:hypothetical protein
MCDYANWIHLHDESAVTVIHNLALSDMKQVVWQVLATIWEGHISSIFRVKFGTMRAKQSTRVYV